MEFDRAGFDREVGVRLQRARKERGITQRELAKRIGLPRPSYANIESGRQRIPLDVVWRAAIVLDLSLAALTPEPLPPHIGTVPLLPLTASVISPSPQLASMSVGFMAWRKSPDTAEE
jgi:transcriptional regulator with XRE-family HTH domain